MHDSLLTFLYRKISLPYFSGDGEKCLNSIKKFNFLFPQEIRKQGLSRRLKCYKVSSTNENSMRILNYFLDDTSVNKEK